MYNNNIKLKTEIFLDKYFDLNFDDNKKNLECLQDAVELIQEYKELCKTNVFSIISKKNEYK